LAARRRKAAANEGGSSTRIVRRRPDSPSGLRKLPPDFEDLAAGRRDTLRPRRRPRGRIGDTRIAGLIAGVANHEARQVYDARVERARRLLDGGDEAVLAQQLCEAILLGVWRARSVTGFEAFAQDVIGVPAERARELAGQHAARQNVALEQLQDVAVALWLRSEAALLERCPDAAVEVKTHEGRLQLSVVLPLAPPLGVAEAVAAIGRSAAGLVRVLESETRPPRDRDRDRNRNR
jgi:hypothetical protein